MRVFPLIGYLWLVVAPVLAEDKTSDRVADVVAVPGCVAVWDFVKREPGVSGGFWRMCLPSAGLRGERRVAGIRRR